MGQESRRPAEMVHQVPSDGGGDPLCLLPIDNMADGFALFEVIFAPDSSPVDFRFLRVNRQFEKLTGLASSVVNARTISEVFPSADSDWIEKLLGVARSGLPAFCEECSGEGDRHFQFTAFRPHPNQLAVVFGDVTQQRRDAASLRRSEERFHSTFDGMLEGCQIIGFDWRYIYINPVAEIHNHRPAGELLGKRYADVWPGVERTEVFQHIRCCLEHRVPKRMENLFVYPDGSQGWFELAIEPVPEGVFILSMDITARKRAEDKARADEKRLGMALDAAEAAAWEVNLETGRHHWDERFLDMLRVPEEDRSNFEPNWIEYVHPEDAPRALMEFKAAILVGAPPYDSTFRATRMDGVTRWYHSRGNVISPPGHPRRMFGVAQDITERVEALEAIKESERRFRGMVEGAPDPIFIQTDRMISYVNAAGCRLFGANSASDLLGLPVVELFHPESRPILEQRMRRLNVDRLPVRELFEHRALRLDGREVWVETSGEPIHYEGRDGALVFVRDISLRKRAEAALQQSESRFRALAESAPIGIVITDKHDRTVFVSSRFTETFGYTIEDLPSSRHWWERAYPDHHLREGAKREWEAIQQAADAGSILDPVVHPIVRKDGQVRHVELRLAATKEWNFITLTDVTERVCAEEEHDKLQAQFLQAQKMESVGRLAGGVAHDFNNMLSVIIGHAEIALDALDEEHALVADLQEILKAAQRSADLTRQLLAFARRQTVTPKVLNLNEAIEGMLKMLRRLIGEQVNLEWVPGRNLPPVRIDPSQLDQVLANLCVNARDAIGDKIGRIVIATEARSVDELACIGQPDIVPGDYIQLTFADNGCGMPPEILSRLFEPFFTTKEIGKGTGLGLATVHGVVLQNSGFITVESKEGVGTTFRICLPQHKETNAQAAPSDAPGAVHGNETVLLVEDEPAILNLTRQILEHLGYRVLATHSPEAAIRLARNSTARIDLILTDVIMPGMNGRDLAKELAKNHSNLSCLFMSGYTADAISPHGIMDDGVHFLQKPFTIKDLARKVREALQTPHL